MEINGYRTLTDALNGTHHAAALGACNKMFWSETHQETMELAMDILGLDGQILAGDEPTGSTCCRLRRGRADYPVDALQASFFFSRSETIWGGTAEIQRNIVGERVLGLPKEPKPTAGPAERSGPGAHPPTGPGSRPPARRAGRPPDGLEPGNVPALAQGHALEGVHRLVDPADHLGDPGRAGPARCARRRPAGWRC